uniref:Uncharacterized protein n=1 Tax=Anguilla anguilla TaxID=7936 RepID=A0A0E9TX01_ANGAN
MRASSLSLTHELVNKPCVNIVFFFGVSGHAGICPVRRRRPRPHG